jgi:hypothetical protein
LSVEEVAQLFNTTVDEFTPAKFKQVYRDTWIKEHEQEAAEKNPNADAELAIIEQVMNETDSALPVKLRSPLNLTRKMAVVVPTLPLPSMMTQLEMEGSLYR